MYIYGNKKIATQLFGEIGCNFIELLVYFDYLPTNVLLQKCAPNIDAHAIKMTLPYLDTKYV